MLDDLKKPKLVKLDISYSCYPEDFSYIHKTLKKRLESLGTYAPLGAELEEVIDAEGKLNVLDEKGKLRIHVYIALEPIDIRGLKNDPTLLQIECKGEYLPIRLTPLGHYEAPKKQPPAVPSIMLTETKQQTV